MGVGRNWPRVYSLTDCDAKTIALILWSATESYPAEIGFPIRGPVPDERAKKLASSLMLQGHAWGESWFIQHPPGEGLLLKLRSREFSPAASAHVFLSDTNKRTPRTEASVVTTEPRVAKGIASLLLPHKHRTTFLGDLHEDYSSVEREQGPRSAKWWYRKEVAKEVFPSLWNLCVWPALRKLVSEAVKQLSGG